MSVTAVYSTSSISIRNESGLVASIYMDMIWHARDGQLCGWIRLLVLSMLNNISRVRLT
jgi:hypothetical protein